MFKDGSCCLTAPLLRTMLQAAITRSGMVFIVTEINTRFLLQWFNGLVVWTCACFAVVRRKMWRGPLLFVVVHLRILYCNISCCRQQLFLDDGRGWYVATWS
jgi:hypothetical protein